jgi:hypothetical protein
MPGGSGDYDAGGMVWGSMIGKKLFGGSGLPSGPGLASGCCSGSWARLSALVSGRGRMDEPYSCWTGLHATPKSLVTISCYLYLQRDDGLT